jgi:RNA polymerase sigma-70 factor, ECF subfamily
MTEPSDLDLIGRFGSPDPNVRASAFTQLFERHRQRAFELAYRVLGDAGLASDAVQEAFLAVYKKGARFQARAQFTSWLYRVVLNHSIDLQRRERRHKHRPLVSRTTADGEGGETLPVPDDRSNPEAAAHETERARRVREATSQLSPKLAEVVILRYPQGHSYEEIGEILGLPSGTVKSRLNRAHAALRELLDDDDRDDGA